MKLRKRIYIVLVGLGVVTTIALIVGILMQLTGYLVISFKTPQQSVLTRTVVCDDRIIDRYNKISSLNDSGSDMKSLVGEIENKPNYKKDPTCVFIDYQYRLSLSLNDKQEMATTKRLYTSIVESADQGIYPSIKLNHLYGIPQLEQILKNSQPSAGA